MIEIPIPWLLFGLPALLVLGAVFVSWLANRYFRRGFWAAREKHAPTLSPAKVRELFDGVRNAVPVDDTELAGARPVKSGRQGDGERGSSTVIDFPQRRRLG